MTEIPTTGLKALLPVVAIIAIFAGIIGGTQANLEKSKALRCPILLDHCEGVMSRDDLEEKINCAKWKEWCQ